MDAINKGVVDRATDLRSNDSFVGESLNLSMLHILRRSLNRVQTYVTAYDLNIEVRLNLLQAF